jgi:hypothetical protein
VFSDCWALKSVYLPASLEEIDVSVLLETSINTISFEEGNSHFRVSGQQLLSFDGKSLLRSFGNNVEVEIGRSIECLCEQCFRDCKFLKVVKFESESSLTRIEESAFQNCSSLRSITIPRSVEILCKCCFSKCISLSSLVFESDSKLRSIPDSAFSGCSSLQSLVIPQSVESLGPSCFHNCISLKDLSAEDGSNLREIESDAFIGCCSLQSFDPPPGVKVNSKTGRQFMPPKRRDVDSVAQCSKSSKTSPKSENVDFQSKDTIPIHVTPKPQQKLPRTLFSDPECESLADEFESGYDQFLSVLDSSVS